MDVAKIIREFQAIFGITATERKWLTDQITAAMPPAQEWRPISMAKDGVPVLGMNKHGDVGHTHRVESDGDVPAYWWNDQDDDEWHPLWWMPALPPMPNTLIAEERTDG